MRHSMLTGTRPDGCRSCWSQWNIPYVKPYGTFCVEFHSGFTGFSFYDGRSCRFVSSVPPSLTVDTTQIVDRQPVDYLKDDDNGQFFLSPRLRESDLFQLLRYLRPECAVYHVRAVNLVWQLENANPRPHVEAVLSQSLASPQSRNNRGAYEAFGVLWRLTGRLSHTKIASLDLHTTQDDNLLPGFRFKVPMMITLDTLRSDDTVIKHIGEMWMRCSLKSYLR